VLIQVYYIVSMMPSDIMSPSITCVISDRLNIVLACMLESEMP
jgi:hypothetical protein